MKRLKGIIQNIEISHKEIKVSLSNIPYMCFIQGENINWYPKDNNGNSILGVLKIGTHIEFDRDYNSKTRNLKNVEILLNDNKIQGIENKKGNSVLV